jgi:hypothetical protein
MLSAIYNAFGKKRRREWREKLITLTVIRVWMDALEMLNIRIEEKLKKELEKYCESNNVTVSDLVRDLISFELRQKDKIVEKGHEQLLGIMREKGLVTEIANRPEQTAQEHKTFEASQPLIQGLTLEKKILSLAILVSASIEETILTRSYLLALARVMNLQHFKGRLNSEAAISDFALLDRAIRSTQEDLDAAEKLSNSFKKAADQGEKKP